MQNLLIQLQDINYFNIYNIYIKMSSGEENTVEREEREEREKVKALAAADADALEAQRKQEKEEEKEGETKKTKDETRSILLEDERKRIKKEEEEERMLYKEHGPLYIIENGDNGESIKLRIKKKQSEKGRHFVVKSVQDSPTYQGMDQSTAQDSISWNSLRRRMKSGGDKRPLIEEVGGYKKRRKTRRKRKTRKTRRKIRLKKRKRRKSRKKTGHNLLGGGI